MTVLLILTVIYLFLANCVHRRRVRVLETLLLVQALEGDDPEEVPEGVVEPPSWTYTMN